MPFVFVSYKRGQKTNSTARALHLQLTRYFGEEALFLDHALIADSENIHDYIREKLLQCEVMVILVDKLWKHCMTADGGKYPTRHNYLLGAEIEEALNTRSIHPFLVLLDDNDIPLRTELPEKLVGILRHKAIRFRSENFQEDFSRLIRELERFIQGSARRLPIGNMPNYERYYNEVQYCMEGNLGELNDVSRCYLNTLAKYLDIVRQADQAGINNRARRTFLLYRAIVSDFIASSVQQNPEDDFVLTGVTLKYLHRLSAIFEILRWKAQSIEANILAQWESKVQKYRRDVLRSLDNLSVDNLLNAASMDVTVNRIVAKIPLSPEWLKPKAKFVARKSIQTRKKVVQQYLVSALRIIEAQHQKIQTHYQIVMQRQNDHIYMPRLEMTVKRVLLDHLRSIRTGEPRAYRGPLPEHELNQLLPTYEIPEHLIEQIAIRALVDWCRRRRNAS